MLKMAYWPTLVFMLNMILSGSLWAQEDLALAWAADEAGLVGPTSEAVEGRETLFGPYLHGRGGVTVDYHYIGEVFNNMKGGLRTDNATRYAGRFDLLLKADLGQLDLVPGGVFVVHGQNFHGQGITDDFAGVYQRISNIDAPYNFTQVAQYWYQQSLLDGFLTFRLGKIYADSEFALASLGGDFINTSLGWTHTIPMPAYPNASAAALMFVRLSDWLEFKAGVWDGAPNGRTWGFSGTGDVFSIYEFKAKYALCDGGLPGDCHVGMWYHSGEFADPVGNELHAGNHGVYCGASQMLTRENPCDPNDRRGLGAFVQFGWAPEDRNLVEQYWGGGLVYQGLLRSREQDTCGVGLGNMGFGSELLDRNDETMIEVFYKAQLTPYMYVQPDLQYFSHPNGNHRDAFVAGLRFCVNL